MTGGRRPKPAPLPFRPNEFAEKSYEHHRPVLSRSRPSGGSRCECRNPGQCPFPLAARGKSLGRDGKPRREDRRAAISQRRGQDGRGDDGRRLVVPGSDLQPRLGLAPLSGASFFLSPVKLDSGRKSSFPFNGLGRFSLLSRNSGKFPCYQPKKSPFPRRTPTKSPSAKPVMRNSRRDRDRQSGRSSLPQRCGSLNRHPASASASS